MNQCNINYVIYKNFTSSNYKLSNIKFLSIENDSAGTRVRVAMQKLKALAQDLRVEIQDAKKK